MAGNFTQNLCEFQNTNELLEEASPNALQVITKSIKLLNLLPCGVSRVAFNACPSFGKIIDLQSDSVLKIISKILKFQNVKGNIERRQQDEQMEMVMDCNDIMLECVNSVLDNLCGITKHTETIITESNLKSVLKEIRPANWNLKISNQSCSKNNLLTSFNIPRPQINFKVPVDNSSNTPFTPKLKIKPNSLTPLRIIPNYDSHGDIESFPHPYEYELLKFEPPVDQLEIVPPQKSKDVSDTEYFFIDDENKLTEVLNALKKEKAIAVDLEHHSYRSYQGITCLMQISSYDKDYIIDTIILRDDLQCLNEIFTDPKILKIFHGADLDIEWLQRDLGLYVVNMFDTHQAAKMLGLGGLSLKFLLKYYCNIEADKKFQLADWRMRPLPIELINYARQDTHYLIYIADMLKNELLYQANGLSTLKAVYNKSKDVCRKTYIKPKITDESYLDLYRRSKRAFDNMQLYALKNIYLWRDKTARFEDESWGYILPNHMLLQIAESLPREMQGILACCNPVPPAVKQNLSTLHKVILKAREQPLIKLEIHKGIVNRMLIPTKSITSKLNCLYDASHEPDFNYDLTNNDFSKNSFFMFAFNCKPILKVFEYRKTEKKEKENYKISKSKNTKFVSPYQRYKAVIRMEKEKWETNCNIQQGKSIQHKNTNDENMKESVVNNILKIKEDPEYTKIEIHPKNENVIFTSISNMSPKLEPEEKKNISSSNKNDISKYHKEAAHYRNLKNKNCETYEESKNFSYSKLDLKKFRGGSCKPGHINKSGFISKQNTKKNYKKLGKILTYSTGSKKK